MHTAMTPREMRLLSELPAKAKVYLFMCGISHDLGKILEWQLETGGYTFNPYTDNLRTFEHPYTFKSKREGFGYRESAIHGSKLMTLIEAKCSKFALSKDYSPAEISLVAEAINCHHVKDDNLSNNPYWRALRQADIEDIEAYGKMGVRQAVAQAQVVNSGLEAGLVVQGENVNLPQVELAQAAQEVSDDAMEQYLIQAVRNLIFDKLKIYENSSFFAAAEGWLLLVAPIYISDIKKAAPGIVTELAKLVNRAFDATTVVSLLKTMGLAAQVEVDETRSYPRFKIESGGQGIDALMYLPLVAAKIFSEDELAAMPSCRILNLEDFAEPTWVNPEVGAFYEGSVKGRIRGDYLAAAMKLLAIYDAEPETPSVIDDGLVQEERGNRLYEHALDVARIAVEGAETGDYPALLVAALAHDIGKAGAAKQQLTVLKTHDVAGMAFIGKLLGKKSVVKDALVDLVKNHHGEVKGLVAERIRAAHVAGAVADLMAGAVELDLDDADAGADLDDADDLELVEDLGEDLEEAADQEAAEIPQVVVELHNGLIAPELQDALPF